METNSFYDIADEISSLFPIPIRLEDVIEDEGLNVIYDDYGQGTFDGMTWYVPGQDEFFIHMNTARGNTKGSAKGRFTLAHELGHYFIDHHRQALECIRDCFPNIWELMGFVSLLEMDAISLLIGILTAESDVERKMLSKHAYTIVFEARQKRSVPEGIIGWSLSV